MIPAQPARAAGSVAAGRRAPSNVMFLSMITFAPGCHNQSCSSNSAFRGAEMVHRWECKVDQMPNGSAELGPVPTVDATGGDMTQTIQGRGQDRRPPGEEPAIPPTETVGGAPPDAVAHVVRYGPGVPGNLPAGHPELTAAHVWRAPGNGKPRPRRPRLRRLPGLALTVILLAASGVLLYQRLHHAPFHVTGAAITQRARNGCGVVVTARISTNGSAGTVSYQWLVEPIQQPPQPLSQSVPSGSRDVYVSISVEGAGHGSASQTVMLQVLGPDTRTASSVVAVSC